MSRDGPSRAARLYTASDLVALAQCPYRALQESTGARPPAASGEDLSVLVRRRGLEHESRFVADLEQRGEDVVRLEPDSDAAAGAVATQAAMQAGRAWIYQGTLVHDGWMGRPDLLRRVEGAGPAPAYEPVDLKLARTPEARHLVQLGLYAQLLGAHASPPVRMHLVLGDGVEKTYEVAAFAPAVRALQRCYETFVHDTAAHEAVQPEPCVACATCPWRPACEAAWDAADHLNRLPGVHASTVRKLRAAGIDTIAALAASADVPRVAGIAPATLAHVHALARLRVAARRAGAPQVEWLQYAPGSGRGLDRLPAPDPADVFFDIEGDPLAEPPLEYLLGVVRLAGGESQYRSFWAHDVAEERRSFAAFVDDLAAWLDAHPGARIYHYGDYERAALLRLAMRHTHAESVIDDWLRQGRLVDLYRVSREALRTSQPGMSIKDLEAFYMQRQGTLRAGADSIVVYDAWRRSGEAQLLESIAAYNEEDCRSLVGLRDWLLQRREASVAAAQPQNVFATNTPDSVSPPAPSERAATRRALRAALRQRVLERAATSDGSGAGSADAIGTLLAELLHYHERDRKPEYWALFDRQHRTEEELHQDPECLAGLEPAPAPSDGLLAFRFPTQETKLRAGKRVVCTATLEAVGTIVHLDEARGVVHLRPARRGRAANAPRCIGPGWPVAAPALEASLERTAQDWVASGRLPTTALDDLLHRRPPRLHEHPRGAPLVPAGMDPAEAAARHAANLEGSYLDVQGPPGTGKTRLGARIVVDALARGRKVAITAHAHKAIHQLLAGVSDLARQRQVGFRGIKVTPGTRTSPGDGAGDRDLPPGIREVASSRDLDPAALDLLAGTPWALARSRFADGFDLLVVDEAGQMPLANLVAIAPAARNLVFLGDRMQLAPPTPAAHPGESGASILEYLLQEEATVPPERGVFLERTYRLAPALCRVVSTTFYDGRLQPAPATSAHRLRFPAGVPEDLAAGLGMAGLRWLPVPHDGCRQRSEPEAEVVRRLMESLLTATTARAPKRRLRLEDVLVVAPYNMQVNLLRQALPAGARVGTVDRFQGQEAEVVIVSLTSSSGEDLPRGVEFLLEPNRLNVAISRARTLAIVVGSPRLATIAARTVEALRRIARLGRLMEAGTP